MGRQIRPAQVFKTLSQEINHRVLDKYPVAEPSWFQAVGSIPPAESLVRTIPARQQAPRAKATKPKNLYRPQHIRYQEDALRKTFYKDHPWELARPRTIVELDGKDYQRCNWGNGLRQPGIPMTGECVVQRQLWLMEVDRLPKTKAYDQARKEFYRIRQSEEIERRIALEEARYVGAYFGYSRLEIGMHLEDREFESWKQWAADETAKMEQRAKNQIETFDVEGEAEDTLDTALPTETGEQQKLASL